MQDLHHPAMRDRHWKMLMQTTGKHFVMDEKFCLGDLLALGLHNYVDACRWVCLPLKPTPTAHGAVALQICPIHTLTDSLAHPKGQRVVRLGYC